MPRTPPLRQRSPNGLLLSETDLVRFWSGDIFILEPALRPCARLDCPTLPPPAMEPFVHGDTSDVVSWLRPLLEQQLAVP
eukprot:3306498-Prymnesium_polylepis.1